MKEECGCSGGGGGGGKWRMHFALNKAADFSNSLGIHIWGTTSVAGTLCANTKKQKNKQRTEDGQEAEKRKRQKKGRKKKTSVLLFVFSLVYLVWGSLVYNIYHHVFQNYLLRNWLYGKVKKKKNKDVNGKKKKIKVISLDLKPHKANDMPCRPSFIGSSFWFLKTGSGSTMYIFMQVFKKFITVCLAITTLFTL